MIATADAPPAQHSWFKRILLPGLALKAFVIGGGYATGRELVEFFLSAGPWGGLFAILFATLIMSFVSAITFLFARRFQAYDYRTFFRHLLGPGWVIFELCYLLVLVLILAVYGAAAGSIGQSMFGAPEWFGTALLMIGISVVVALGSSAVERLFRDVSYLLYGVYALFIILALSQFGDRIPLAFANHQDTAGWAMNGLSYAGYNTIGAVIILPVLRHLMSDRDAVVSGLIAGPLTMIPALMFFVPMVAFYPGIVDAAIPADHILKNIGLQWFHLLFQVMIFAALLESGTSAVHALNERIDAAYEAKNGQTLTRKTRLLIALILLGGCMFLAGRFGIVTLIANGYRFFGYVFIAVFLVPVATVGVARIIAKGGRGKRSELAEP